MNIKGIRHFFIVVFALNATAACKTTHADNEVSVTADVGGISTLLRQHALANGKFPQMDTGIALILAETFLSQNISADQMAAELNASEVQKMGEIMNSFHRSNNVDAGFNSSQFSGNVTEGRLQNLIVSERTIALLEIRLALDIMQRKLGSPTLTTISPVSSGFDPAAMNRQKDEKLKLFKDARMRYQLALEIASYRNNYSVKPYLERLSSCLKRAIADPRLEEASRRYKVLLKDPLRRKDGQGRLQNLKEALQVFRQVLRDSFITEFSTVGGDISEAFIWKTY